MCSRRQETCNFESYRLRAIYRSNGISIHGGVIPQGHSPGGIYICRENSSDGFEYFNLFNSKGVGQFQYGASGFFKGGHRAVSADKIRPVTSPTAWLINYFA